MASALVGASAVFAATAPSAPIGPQTVYVMGMGHGFDQYLANQLLKQGVCSVTTDPKTATAVLTDRLGEGFERDFLKLYPPAAPKEQDKSARETGGFKGDMNWTPPNSSFARGRGNLFLVDVQTRRVIWSTHLNQKRYRAEDLDHDAAHVARRWAQQNQPVAKQ